MHDWRDHVQPARNAGCISDQILPHFNAQIGNAIPLPMTVHRRIEEFARIGKLITHDDPLQFQRRDRDARGAIVIVVEYADFPWSIFVRPCRKPRRKTVERQKHAWTGSSDRSRNLPMIGAPEAIDPLDPADMRYRVAGNCMAVARGRDDVRRVFLAIEIDNQPRYATQYRRNTGPLANRRCKLCNANVERDVRAKQCRVDTQIDIHRHMV